jgi:hypothetical protein
LLLIISFVLLIVLFIFLSSKIAKYTISHCLLFFDFEPIYLNSILYHCYDARNKPFWSHIKKNTHPNSLFIFHYF